MNVISGKVVERESYAPIPDLLIVAYDWDGPSLGEQLSATGDDFRTGATPPPALMRFWDRLQSDRLGSVLTERDGTFRLEFADDLFSRRPSTDSRPDLVLFVLAPEDTSENSGQLSPHPLQRMLHFSYSIRTGAGRNEAYMIRLPREALVAAGVPFGSHPLGEAPEDPERIIATLERRLTLEQTLRTHPRLVATLTPHREASQRLEQEARSFASGILRVGLRNVSPSEWVARSVEDRQILLERAFDQGLAGLAGRGERLRIPLVGDAARRAEANPAEAGTVLDEEAPVDLLRTRRMLDACRARQLCRTIANNRAHEGNEREDEYSGPRDTVRTPPPTRELAEGWILDKVLGQIDKLPSAASQTGSGEGALWGLEERLDALRLRGGAADNIAYHDFHSLQIAFKSVWEQVYSEALEEEVAALYRDWVRVREYVGLPAPTEATRAELGSLKQFLRKVESDLSAAAGLAEQTGTFIDFDGVVRTVEGATPERSGARSARLVAESVAGDSAPRTRVVVGRPGASVDDGQASTSIVRPVGSPVARMFDSRRSTPRASQTRSVYDQNLLARVSRLLGGLAARLSEPYAFDVFAPNTFNFGLLVTYRQAWQPDAYQVGELVSTMPLAPGERRTYSTKKRVKTSRAQKEVENSLSSRQGESSQTGRAEADIVNRAAMSTNFKQTARGEFSLGGFATFGTTTEFGNDQRSESEQRKRNFRESIRRAAEEYKSERTVEVSSSTSTDEEYDATGEIANTNNEIAVTYLFYELQRRYRVNETLHRVRPVILVAQDLPSPDEIDEAWLVTHEWILRRVILDDGLLRALDYVTESLAGDETAVEVLRATWERNLQVVRQLSAQLDRRSAVREEVRSQILRLMKRHERDDTARDVAAAIFSGGLSLLFGGGSDSASLEAAKEAADRELEFADDAFAQIEGRLHSAVSALENATDQYVAALRAQMNRRVAVDQLRVHVKENILYYMHAIWSHEPDDQRFFRLYNLEVPWVELEEGPPPTLRSVAEREISIPLPSSLLEQIFGVRPLSLVLEVEPRMGRRGMRTLSEVADLDQPLGFKGNYIIFPLKVGNPLTRFMMQGYIPDPLLGVLDPDDAGNVTSADLEALLECAGEDLSEEQREAIQSALCELLVKARHDVETVVVPTGELYIEALPGAQPVLEDFKRLHRAIDVRRAEGELRGIELENLRRAGRIVAGELEDPDIERKTVVEGANEVVVRTE